MPKPLKFHQTLNQAPRSMKHGRNRRTSPQAYGHPVIGADLSAGGADEDVTAINLTWSKLRAVSFAFPKGASPSLTTAPQASLQQAALDFQAVVDLYLTGAVPPHPPQPREIPHSIRTGEIIGHRLWWVLEEDKDRVPCLCSLAHVRIWKPGETITGDVNIVVVADPFDDVIYGGTYSYKAEGRSRDEFADAVRSRLLLRHPRRSGPSFSRYPIYRAIGVVLGTISMWGEVVEHELGYRAEFAKLRSIDEVAGEVDLADLRARYGV